MKKLLKIAFLSGISSLFLVNVSANCEIYDSISPDSLSIAEEKLVARFEPEMEVEAWMIEPFVFQSAVYEDQIADMEPEMEVEAWMTESFLSPSGVYAYQDKTSGNNELRRAK